MTKVIATAIEIAAAPERVWHVLTDFAAYPRWNPFIRSVEGSAKTGRKLIVEIRPPGAKASRFTPTVLAAEANRELRWKGKLLVRGLFDGEHSFRLEPTATGTRFIHAETFSGLLPALMRGSLFEQIERGFAEMNNAIKPRAEAR